MVDDAQVNRPPNPPTRRRPIVDDVFGEVLPETTRDERDPGRPDQDQESWYRENRPPHHDRD